MRVRCDQQSDGTVSPKELIWPDGRSWEIRKTLHMAAPVEDEFEGIRYDELLAQLNVTLKNIVLAILICVLFAGSCTLCTTNIQPQTNGVPLVALIGFVVSVALGIYAVASMTAKKK